MMFSKGFDYVKETAESILSELCPCLLQANQSSHKKDLSEANSPASVKNAGKNKIFTIETMKKRNLLGKERSKSHSKDNKDLLAVEKVPWDTEKSDMFLRVEKSAFPVHQFLLSIESEILKTIIDSIPQVKNATTVVTLNGYEADEIKMLLTYVYLPESEINDNNINTLLKLADELMIEELVIRCEDYLLASQQSPISLLNLAFKYQLPSLEEAAAIEASKIPGIDQTNKFKSLSIKQQQKVRCMAENRYRSGFSGSQTNRDDRVAEDTKSPKMKMERKLNEKVNDFKGQLSFLPDAEGKCGEKTFRETHDA